MVTEKELFAIALAHSVVMSREGPMEPNPKFDALVASLSEDELLYVAKLAAKLQSREPNKLKLVVNNT